MYVSFDVALFTHTKRGCRYLMHIFTRQPTSLLFKPWQSYRIYHGSLKASRESGEERRRESGFSRSQGLGPEELPLRVISLMLTFKIFVVGGKCQLSSKLGFYSWLKVFFSKSQSWKQIVLPNSRAIFTCKNMERAHLFAHTSMCMDTWGHYFKGRTKRQRAGCLATYVEALAVGQKAVFLYSYSFSQVIFWNLQISHTKQNRPIFRTLYC